jgi:hypothetical protein
MNEKKNVSRHAIAASLIAAAWIAYAISLALPAIYDTRISVPGWQMLALGWIGFSELNFAWFANVFFLFSTLFFILGRYFLSSLTALCAVGLSLQSFQITRHEPGIITGFSLESGFYLWLAALLIAATVALLQYRHMKSHLSGSCATARYEVIAIGGRIHVFEVEDGRCKGLLAASSAVQYLREKGNLGRVFARRDAQSYEARFDSSAADLWRAFNRLPLPSLPTSIPLTGRADETH